MVIKIQPLFESKLAEDFQAPGSKIIHKKGETTVAFNVAFVTKDLGKLQFIAPVTSHLMLRRAEKLKEECQDLMNSIKLKQKALVFSSLSKDSNMTAERAIKEDPNAEKIVHIPENEAYGYIESTANFNSTLISAFETFANANLPNNITDTITYRDGSTETVDVYYIQRYFSLEDKLNLVAKSKNINDLKQQTFWSIFKEAKDLRNDLIHLRKKQAIFVEHGLLYQRVFDQDQNKVFRATIELLNYIRPGYVVEV